MNGYVVGQNEKISIKTNGDEVTFLSNYFKPGLYQADLMTGSKNNERRVELTEKMYFTVRNYYDWYIEFVKDTPDGLPVKYDEKLGLTIDEFKELRQIIDNVRLASELTFNFAITMKDSILEFESTYNKGLYDSLRIDLVNEKIMLGSREFIVTDTINLINDNNRMGSLCKGYQWTYQIPSKIDFSNVAELVKNDVILYRISFGILRPSNTLYLSIKGVELEKGIQKVSFTIPIYLKTKNSKND